MYVNAYTQSLHILNVLGNNNTALGKSLKRIANGQRINGAGDDASGYSISHRMDAELRSLEQDSRNTQNGMSIMKTAEGAVSSTVDILRTLKERVLDAANDTNTDEDRATIQKELDQMVDQMDDNANVTFNGVYLVDGSKNDEYEATAAFTNKSLDAATTFSSTLLSLKNRNHESLGMTTNDTVVVSYTKQGNSYSKSFDVNPGMTVLDLFNQANAAGGGAAFDLTNTSATSYIGEDSHGDDVFTSDGTSALTIKSNGGGTSNAVTGFTINVVTNTGPVRRAANAALDAFGLSIAAANESFESVTLQTGTKASQNIKAKLGDIRTTTLGLKGDDGTILNVRTREGANAAIDVVDTALEWALDIQTTIGAVQSRLAYTNSNIITSNTNVTAAVSTIRDADMAREMTEYTKNNVLLQAAQSMLAQANQNSAGVLSLLK